MKQPSLIGFLLLLLSAQFSAMELELDAKLFHAQKLNFRIEAFIDGRIAVAKPVGYTKLGLGNRPEAMLLPANFGRYCDSVFRFPARGAGTMPSLIAVIRQITVLELIERGNECSDVTLSMDFYRLDSASGSYGWYYQSYQKYIFGPVMDATSRHSKTLANAFFKSFEDLSAFMSGAGGSGIGGEMVSREQLLLNSGREPADRSSADTTLSDGIYLNVWQLLKNRPAHLPALQARVNSLKVENTDASLVWPDAVCYAFVKNGELFVCARKSRYHKARINFAARQLQFQANRKQVKMATLGNSFGISDAPLGAVSSPSGSYSHELLLDLESGCFIK